MSELAGRRGGVVLRVGATLLYVAAADAVKLAPIPNITRVPGAPEGLLGIALHEGAILPIVEIGEERESMLVCVHAGARLGVVGGRVVASGMFDPAPDETSVLHEGEAAAPLDVAALCARTTTLAWGERWLS